jgi:hypothetical protein
MVNIHKVCYQNACLIHGTTDTRRCPRRSMGWAVPSIRVNRNYILGEPDVQVFKAQIWKAEKQLYHFRKIASFTQNRSFGSNF